MTTTTSATSSSSDIASLLNGSSNTPQTAAESQDRFLKLLVTQMQNQDPLNPMDNSQMTSQIAQINTVSGIQQLNTTMTSLSSQFVQMQALQGAALVGRVVTLQGNQMAMGSDGKGYGGVDLAGAADSVKVDVLNGAGRVVDTIDLGAQGSGRHDFTWTPPSGVTDTAGLTFKVTATSGTSAVTATPLMHDTVSAVNTSGSTLTLELANSGETPYTSIKSFD